MAGMNDHSIDCRRWTNAKLMREARSLANLETFGCRKNFHGDVIDGNIIREETSIYRDTWLTPILDEIERRFVRGSR